MFSKEDANESKTRTGSSAEGGQGMLMDTSSMSRKLAHGQGKHDRNVTNAILANDEAKDLASNLNDHTRAAYSADFLFALCRVYATVLARWGGDGRDDIVSKAPSWENPRSSRDSGEKKAWATAKADPLTRMLLNVLCFSTPVIQTTWALSQSDPGVVSDLYSVIDTKRR